MLLSEVEDLIAKYYEKRQYKWPTTVEAFLWASSEMGEVADVLIQREGGWVRNNPENHLDVSNDHLAAELGDAIFMLIVTGMTCGIDPLQAMVDKMNRKMPK